MLFHWNKSHRLLQRTWGYSNMDVSQYLEIFLDETKEHLQTLSDQLMILEQEPENMDTINEIFRAAHSLKGMAGTMGYKRMQNLTHDMENVFSEVRNNTIKVDGSMVDVLFQCLDALEEYTDNIQNSSDEGENDNEHLIKALNDILNGEKAVSAEKKDEPAKEEKAAAPEQSAPESGAKFKDIKLTDSEHVVLGEAAAQNKNIIGITVYINESCILKAARAFLVFKAVEELGEIIVSHPSAQDIEDEKFDFDFSLILVTDHSVEEAKNAVLGVSEIENAALELMHVEPAKISDNKGLAIKQADKVTAGGDAQKGDAKQAAAKQDYEGFFEKLSWMIMDR